MVLGLIPNAPALAAGPGVGRHDETPLTPRERRGFLLMAGVLVLGGTVMALVSVHLIALLQARGVALAAAVSYGALIGPAQVGARIVEMANKGRHHPLWTLTVAMVLVAVGLAILALGIPAVAFALVLYGVGNGIYSIARGTVPLALFGAGRYPVLVGRLARPGLVAQALAPSLGAVALTYGGPDTAYVLLAALALANVGLASALWSTRPETGVAQTELQKR
jgi:hypothetical protein